MVARRSPSPVSPPAASITASLGGTPPDLSALSPRERFDRLYNRVMQAAESGDQATVTTFTPMALMAYAQLPSFDADAQYHAALLKLHTGDPPGALALGDSIQAAAPGHLFGYVVKGTVARWQKDQRSLDRAYAEFLGHYDAEVKANRPEYGDHKTALDEFLRSAQSARNR